MSDSLSDPISPVGPVTNAAPIQPVRAHPAVTQPADHTTSAAYKQAAAAAATGGTLPAAYAQFVVNHDTHDVVIRIRDSATDRVIEEYPSPQVEEMAKYMKAYADTLARHRAARQSPS